MSGPGVAAYGPLFQVAAIASFAVTYVSWRRRPAPGALGLALWSAATGIWGIAYAIPLMLASSSPSLPWFAVRVTSIGAAVTGFLILVIEHVGAGPLLQRRIGPALLVMPLLTLFVIVTDPLHGWYLAGAEPAMRVTRGGPWFIVNSVYLWGILLVAILLLMRDLIVKRGLYRLQTTILLAAITVPSIVMGMELSGYAFMPGVNSTPVAFGVSCVLVSFGLFRLGLFDIVPVARERVIESMPMGMLIFDANDKLVDFNPAARAMLQLSMGALGSSLSSALGALGEDASAVLQAIGAGAHTVEAAHATRQGLVLEVNASEIVDEQGERSAVVVTIMDVSERVATERERRQFVANASHELQTPLADLSLLGSTLEHVAQHDPDQLQPFIGVLRHETDRLIAMTRGLLTLSRLDENAEDAGRGFKDVDVSAVVLAEVASLQAAAAAKCQSLDAHVPVTAMVRGDEAGLAVIVGNLLENAIRYSGSGGSIHVRVTCAEQGEDRSVTIAVSDDGIGIAPEHHDRIFDRFYRVDKARSRETGGSGLGLSIVRSIVERHGGTVCLTSRLGEGSTFTVTLPRD